MIPLKIEVGMDVFVRSGPRSPHTNKSAQSRRLSETAILKNILFDSWPEIVVKISLIRFEDHDFSDIVWSRPLIHGQQPFSVIVS